MAKSFMAKNHSVISPPSLIGLMLHQTVSVCMCQVADILAVKKHVTIGLIIINQPQRFRTRLCLHDTQERREEGQGKSRGKLSRMLLLLSGSRNVIDVIVSLP